MPSVFSWTSFPAACLPLLLLIAAATFADSPPAIAAGRKAPVEIVQKMLQAQLACNQANTQFFQNMQTVANRFERMCIASGRMPEGIPEEELVCQRLNASVSASPYAKSEILANQLQVSASQFAPPQPQVRVFADPGLSLDRLEELCSNPPDQWKLFPGSMLIIHDTLHSFAIVGLGLDGKPLQEEQSKSWRLVLQTVRFR